MDQNHSTGKPREDREERIPIQLKLMLGVLSLAIISLIARVFGIV
jgi:hypothetical protein